MTGHDPLLTDAHRASGWYAILPEPLPANRLTGDQTADWVVVGAGVTIDARLALYRWSTRKEW